MTCKLKAIINLGRREYMLWLFRLSSKGSTAFPSSHLLAGAFFTSPFQSAFSSLPLSTDFTGSTPMSKHTKSSPQNVCSAQVALTYTMMPRSISSCANLEANPEPKTSFKPYRNCTHPSRFVVVNYYNRPILRW